MQEGGDLRTLIDDRMKQHNNQGPPFSIMFATRIMHEIALGMQHLHDHGILHRDLKAANVLVTNAFGEFPTEVNTELMDIKVADFECSMLVKGTGFYRAPEILKQLRVQSRLRGQERIDFRLHFTEEADVYSYGMTCYEVLTGGTPLLDDGIGLGSYEAVYEKGVKPTLPDYGIDNVNRIDDWLRDLIVSCWDLESSRRPNFRKIIREFRKNCAHLRFDR